MTAPVARRCWRGAAVVAVVLAVTLTGPSGTAGAAQPVPVTCTLLGGPLNEPVSVEPGSSVQLVLVVPLLGTRVDVGPAQSVGDQPGEQLLQETVTGVVGLTGQVCQAVVSVQSVVGSAVPMPLPPVTVSTLPGVPQQSVEVPLPGAEVGVDLGGQPAPPAGQPAPPAGPAPPGDGEPDQPADRRFDSRLPLYDFSFVPYGIGFRFGAWSAPAFWYGRQLPGYSPKFGILPGGGEQTRVGAVRGLPMFGDRVALPVLLAVLMLAAVSGGLVRTLAVRRG